MKTVILNIKYSEEKQDLYDNQKNGWTAKMRLNKLNLNTIEHENDNIKVYCSKKENPYKFEN